MARADAEAKKAAKVKEEMAILNALQAEVDRLGVTYLPLETEAQKYDDEITFLGAQIETIDPASAEWA